MNSSIYIDFEKRGIGIAFTHLKSRVALSHADNFICIDPWRIENSAQERTALYHEDGHFESGCFYTPTSPYFIREQAEHRATRAAILKYIPLNALKSAMLLFNNNVYEIAESFCVTEDFIMTAYYYYKEVMGVNFGV